MNAIVFVLRGCSAAWLGAYGNEWIATPSLDRLAAEGVVFDRHFSDCPDPVAACRVWLSGHSTVLNPNAAPALLTTLRQGGVLTVLVRANHPDTDAPDWFYAEWGELFDARPQEDDRYSLDSLIRSLPALLDRLASGPRFLLWIEVDSLLPPWNIRQDVFEAYIEDAEDEETYAKSEKKDDESDEEEDEEGADQELNQVVKVELDDGELLEKDETEEPGDSEPVTPWVDPPVGLFDRTNLVAREWLQSSLAALVTGLDAELGVVFDQLRTRGFDQSAAWLVTSDFGFPLGEHGQIGRYRPWLYEELVHLPLILRLPKAEQACRRVPAFTQSQDLAPTLLALLGLTSANEQPGGINLLPMTQGIVEKPRDSAVSGLELCGTVELAIRTDDWALLLPTKQPEGETRQPQLFSKPDDHWEVNDLRTRNIERSDELEERLRKEVKGDLNQ